MSTGGCSGCDDKIKENCPVIPIDKDRYCNVVNTCQVIANNPVSPQYPGGDAGLLYTSLVNDGNYDQVNEILNQAGTTQLKNQIKYNLCEIAAYKLKCQDTTAAGSSVWSEDWWYENIWGTNNLQKMIYLLSLLVVMFLNLKISYRMLLGEGSIFNKFAKNLAGAYQASPVPNLIPMFLTILSFVILSVVAITYTAKVKGDTPEEVEQKRKDATKIFSGMFIGTAGVTVLLNFISKGQGNIIGYLAEFANIFLFSQFLLFNFSLGAFIPQLMLVGIILQRFLLGSWKFVTDFVLRAVVVAVLFGIIIWYWGAEKTSGTTLSLVMLLAFLVPTGIYLVARKVMGGVTTEEPQWAMILMPFFNLLTSLGKKDDINQWATIGVSNDALFS